MTLRTQLIFLNSLIVLFVALQMAWYVRPLFIPELDAPVIFLKGERGLFFDALEGLFGRSPRGY